MGTVEEFNNAWNYIWAMGNEVIEYSPFLAERDVYKSDRLHEEMLKLKAAFEDAQEEWWIQHNEKRRKQEDWESEVAILAQRQQENKQKEEV